MSAIYLQRHAHRPGDLRRHEALDALSDAAGWAAAGLREWRRRMRDRAELASLDDRTLSDIGLSRSEAQYLINKPFWRK